MKIGIFLPAYNEAARLPRVLEGVNETARSLQGRVFKLVVDDGSTDGTLDEAQMKGFEVIRHERNKGVGASFKTALAWTREKDLDYLIHMDSDGQFDPEEIPLLLEAALSGADLVLGSRFRGAWPEGLTKGKGILIHFLARAIGFFIREPITDASCGFRCLGKKAIQAMNPRFNYDYIQETLIQCAAENLRIAEIPVTVRYLPNSVARAMSRRFFKYGFYFAFISFASLLRFFAKKSRFASKGY